MSFRAFRGSKTIPPVLIAAIVFGIAAGIGAFCRFEYGDPAKTCTLCHEIRGSKERWAKSPHKDVNCKECHAANAEGIAGSSDDRTPLGAQEGMSCTDCHKGHDMKADASRGRCPHPQSASRTTRLKGTHKRFIPVN